MRNLVAVVKCVYADTLNRWQGARSGSRTSRHRRFVLESLEPRVLLSADAGDIAALIDPPESTLEDQVLIWADSEASGADTTGGVDAGSAFDYGSDDAIYAPFDADALLVLEEDAPVSGLDGAVIDLPETADVLTNDNTGTSGTARFTQSETTVLAFDSTVLVGFNDSGSNASGIKFTGFSLSTDGGATFTDGGTLPANPGGDGGDPVLARDNTTGRIYFATLGPAVSTIQVFRSDTGGASWMAPVNGTPGGLGEDKPWLTVDNFEGTGNGNVYLVSRRFGPPVPGIYFFRSTDNGSTFSPTGGTLIVTGSQGAYVTVGPDHSVYVFWYAGSTIQMRKSIDQGLTFSAPATVATFLAPGGVNGDLSLTGIRQGTATFSSFRSNRFPHAAVNPVNGHIYVTYNDDGAGTDRADVYVVRSTTGGASWEAPIKVNDDATTTDQWQPTLAVSTDGAKLGIFYYSRQEDPAGGSPISPTGNNLFKYYARIASLTGPTLAFTPSFAVSDTPSLPEFGRDAVVNPVYMGDYDTAYATPGFFHVVWSDSRDDLSGGEGRKDPNVYYKAIDLGLTVRTTSPAVGSVVVSPIIPTSYVVNFSDPILASSVDAADFTVDGVFADSFIINSPTQVTFQFLSPPFSTQGLHTMAMAAEAIVRATDGDALAAFSGAFRYDAVSLQVTSTIPPTPPPVIGVFTLPGPFTYDVNFNEAVNPESVQTWDLVLTGIIGAFVSAVEVLPGNTTARFTLSGITAEGSLTARIMAGGITDSFGNPGTAFLGSYAVDLDTAPYPTPLVGKDPLGSLIYDPTVSGFVNFAGDVDNFTLNIDPNQTISVILTPTATSLQLQIEIFDPDNVSQGIMSASAPGQIVGIQSSVASLGGVYTFAVSGVGLAIGPYTLQVILNSDFELEGKVAGVTNDSLSSTMQTLNAVDSGWILADGLHSATNNNYFVGQSFFVVFPPPVPPVPPTLTEFRDYFTFSLPAAMPTILGAELRLFNPSLGYSSPDPSETYTLFDVSASPAALDANRGAGDATGIEIHEDLGSGTIYGSRVMTAADRNTTVAIPLDADALAALNAAIGSTISFGGAITTLTGSAVQAVFGGSTGASGTVQLVLQTAPVITAQNIDSSFLTVSTPQASAERGAVIGQTDLANYTAAPVAFAFEDISTTGVVITPITNQDNVSVSIPIGFTFPFFGVNNTSVTVSSNGLLTFGLGGSTPANTDLTTQPGQATIAPFWDDLHTGGGVLGSNVFFQVLGSGADRHLTIQWNKVRFLAGGAAGDTITFQAQLYADGRIQFNYQDLVSGFALGNNGASATVGVKAAGTQGPSRLLLAFNNGPNAFVGTGRSTLLTQATPTPDYYAFTLDAGETTTLAATALAAGNVTVQLRDLSDTVLATGVSGSANLTSVISDFTAAVGGTYFARIAGDGSGVPYSLVVTRNAALDTENNDTPATAQSLGANQAALGYAGGGTILYGANRAGQLFTINLGTGAGTFVGNLPIAITEIEVDNNTGRAFAQSPDGSFSGQEFDIETGAGIGSIIFNGASFTGMEWIGSTLYATAITGPGGPSTLRTLNPFAGTSSIIGSTGFGPISGLAFDPSSGIMYGITGGPVGNLLRLNLTTGLATLIGPTGFRAGSLEVGPDGSLYAGGTGPDEFKIFRINPATGASTLVGMTGIGVAGTADVTGLALVLIGTDDWYSIAVPSTGNPLRLETSTPGDGPGEPINTFNPRIELYDSTGTTLIASGVAMPDGRNEFIAITGLTPDATYKVRVSGEDGTRGEYFLTRNFSPVVTDVTVASPINENDTATVSGTFSDPDALDTHTVIITWGPGEGSTTLTLAAGVLTFSATHQYLDDNPTGTFSDIYAISVTVTDNHSGSGLGGASLTVNNVAPVVAPISGPSSGVRGQSLQFSGSFTDVGSLDTHEVQWDFGDGTVIAFHSTADPNALTPPSHIYTASGVYTLTLSIRDDDGGLTSVSREITITAVAIQEDPCDPGETALVVGGTTGNDTIFLDKQGNGNIAVFINGVLEGVFNPTGHIIAYGQAGDDDIELAASIAMDAWFYGDAGNDRLKSGIGGSILLGGDGDDELIGGSGRSILIGGSGRDRMIGGSGEDLLIGGSTVFDQDATFLCALLNEWNSVDEYAVRVARLRPLLLTTVVDDEEVDMLIGSSGLDWFYTGAGDVVTRVQDDESMG